MRNNAKDFPCEIIYNPKSTKYHKDIRMFQGCPTIAVTKNGRIFLGWYAGGVKEPDMDNYNLLIYSDDNGVSWSEPILVIPSSYKLNIHALDIQLFIDNDEILHIQWVQNNTEEFCGEKRETKQGQPLTIHNGYVFGDFVHNSWEIICENPDAEVLEFSEPRYLYQGFMRCKPTFNKDGTRYDFAYDQIDEKYGYNRLAYKAKDFVRCYGAKKISTMFDEAMAYEMNDGKLRMLARTNIGELAQSFSYDGINWSITESSGIISANSRFYISRLPSGRILLVTNDHRKNRTNMTISLSDDDGITWKYKKCIDTRENISYPDVDFCDEKIYLTYDCGRTDAKEILFASFCEDDIINGKDIEFSIVSKPRKFIEKQEVIKAIEQHKIIAILRNIDKDKLIPLVNSLYDGGIRLIEVPFSESDTDETVEKISVLAKAFEGKMYVGAGTVLNDEQVRKTKLAGGSFIISPNTDEKVIKTTYSCGMISMPGIFTPTELVDAIKYGADYVKIFPATLGGAEFIKAVLAPISNAKIIAVGGVTDKNLKDFITAGAIGVGVGSAIADKELVDREDFKAITENALKYTEQL